MSPLAAALLLTACTPAEQPAALEAGRSFQTALRGADTTAACGLLSAQARGNLEAASARSCADALAVLSLPADEPGAVQVWGDNAQVRLGSRALFLAKFRAGWKVTAAGCSPRPDQPYDCVVEG
jgi:hypothetical protein